MPLKLSVSVSRKVGQPGFGSWGAECGVELELNMDMALLRTDLDGFQREVRDAYIACNQAVQDELARHQHGPAGHAGSSTPHGNDLGNNPPILESNSRRCRSRPGDHQEATAAQLQAIHALADRQEIDLSTLLPAHYQVERVEQLSRGEASRLIATLRAEAG
jgi:hypothetical protein